MENSSETSTSTKGEISHPFLTESRIKKTIIVIKYFYVVLALITVLVLLSDLTTFISIEELAFPLLSIIITLVVVFGLQKRKPWVVMLILFISAIGILNAIIAFSIPSLFTLLLMVMQIYFFTHSEVRKYFGVKGTALF